MQSSGKIPSQDFALTLSELGESVAIGVVISMTARYGLTILVGVVVFKIFFAATTLSLIIVDCE